MELPVSSMANANSVKKKKKSSSGSDDSSSAPAAPALPDEEIIGGHIKSMLAAYEKQPVLYVPEPEEGIRERIAAYLRPAYDQAILNRQDLTKSYHAELDADAYSRGMGASTFVTDVKARQKDNEAQDIGALENEYGAKLAEGVFQAMENEKSRALEADMFNAKNDHEAYMAAYQAALSLFALYKQGSPGSVVSSAASAAETEALDTEYGCISYISGLSGQERRTLYDGGTEEAKKLRSRILSVVGSLNFLYLQQQYPAA